MRKYLIAAVLVMLAGPALAQQVCGPREKMIELLAAEYSEHRIAGGLENSGKLVEIYATADGSTWTAVMSTPDGVSCAVAGGTEWQADAPPKGEGL